MLHEKSLDFAVRIVNFNKYLREEKKRICHKQTNSS